MLDETINLRPENQSFSDPRSPVSRDLISMTEDPSANL